MQHFKNFPIDSEKNQPPATRIYLQGLGAVQLSTQSVRVLSLRVSHHMITVPNSERTRLYLCLSASKTDAHKQLNNGKSFFTVKSQL